jgi:phage shock protein E
MRRHHPGLAILPAIVALGIVACQSIPHDDSRFEDPEVLAQLVSGNAVHYVLVDVRTFAEYVTGHIPTAQNIPFDSIAKRVPTPDTSALIIVYCQSGGRAAIAKKTLDALGYRHVVNFGSISKWKGTLNETELPGECPCKIGK